MTNADIALPQGQDQRLQQTVGNLNGTNNMNCISIYQPWATLVVIGTKKIETRTWKTKQRGRIAIHASQTFPANAKGLCNVEPFQSALAAAGFPNWEQLPTGAIIGSVVLEDCKRSEEMQVSGPEADFGDFRPGRWCWLLSRPIILPVPVPERGRLGVYEVSGE